MAGLGNGIVQKKSHCVKCEKELVAGTQVLEFWGSGFSYWKCCVECVRLIHAQIEIDIKIAEEKAEEENGSSN